MLSILTVTLTCPPAQIFVGVADTEYDTESTPGAMVWTVGYSLDRALDDGVASQLPSVINDVGSPDVGAASRSSGATAVVVIAEGATGAERPLSHPANTIRMIANESLRTT
jgi:actin-like ATPase involved in cell morphogenesis